MAQPTLREILKSETQKAQILRHDGALLIRGNAETGSDITATDDIEIDGDVKNARVRSLRGSVTVRGAVSGASAQVQAGGNIQAREVRNSTLKAAGTITVSKRAQDARLSARQSVAVETEEGVIEGGEAVAGRDILANIIGSRSRVQTAVKLVNFKQSELYAFVLRHEQEIGDLRRSMEKLDKTIAVIRLLGEKVILLPPDKKQELALKVRDYNALKERLTRLESEKSRLQGESRTGGDLERTVIARQVLHEGSIVTIDNAQLPIQKDFKRAILYKKGIIIIADYDDFMRRKKSASV